MTLWHKYQRKDVYIQDACSVHKRRSRFRGYAFVWLMGFGIGYILGYLNG
jgi:hypothetical protein